MFSSTCRNLVRSYTQRLGLWALGSGKEYCSGLLHRCPLLSEIASHEVIYGYFTAFGSSLPRCGGNLHFPIFLSDEGWLVETSTGPQAWHEIENGMLTTTMY